MLFSKSYPGRQNSVSGKVDYMTYYVRYYVLPAVVHVVHDDLW